MGRYLPDPLPKRVARQVLAHLYHRTHKHSTPHAGRVLILAYHRVLPEKSPLLERTQPTLYVTRETFEQHIRFLKARYEVISLSELLELWVTSAVRTDTPYCVLTFDDGWIDLYEYAYPILRRYEVPATAFLPTDYVGTTRLFWPDELSNLLTQILQAAERLGPRFVRDALVPLESQPRLYNILVRTCVPSRRTTNLQRLDACIEELKAFPYDHITTALDTLRAFPGAYTSEARAFVNWDEVREMSRNSISFGSHSASHRLLTNLPIEQVRREMSDSLRVLQAMSVNCVPVLCYPNGYHNAVVKSLAQSVGYLGAMSLNVGTEGLSPYDRFAIRRIGLHEDIANSVPLFFLHLAGPFRSST